MDTNSKRLRVYEKLPVIICEWHQQVLPHIHRAIASRHLPANHISMIHFDAHPDLTFPLKMSADACFQTDVLYDQLEIADWILPLFYEGHLEKVVWMKPKWADQINEGEYKFKVGKDESTGFLKVTWKDDYFIEELLYSKEEDLSDAKDAEVHVKTFESNMFIQKTSGIPSSGQTISNQSGDFILDIDLDFFSTYNPFRLQYSDREFSSLTEMYQFKSPKNLNEDEIAIAIAERQNQLKKLQKTIKYFRQTHIPSKAMMQNQFLNLIMDHNSIIDKSEIDDKYYELLQRFRNKAKECGKELDLELIHFAGMSSDLPHHRSTKDEITESLAELEKFLKIIQKPVFITIARSTEDEYTPQDQVDYIQEEVLRLLKGIYGNLSVIKDYEKYNENT